MSIPHVLDLLPLWVEGDLEPSTLQAVEAHLASCPACRSEAERLRTSQAWLREAMASPFGEDDRHWLRQAVRARVAAEPSRPLRRLATRPALMATGTAALLLAAFAWHQQRSRDLAPLQLSVPPGPLQPTQATPEAEKPAARQAPPPTTRSRPSPLAQAPPEPPTRVEFQTADPTIRIIWLAQSRSLPDTHPSLEEKS